MAQFVAALIALKLQELRSFAAATPTRRQQQETWQLSPRVVAVADVPAI